MELLPDECNFFNQNHYKAIFRKNNWLKFWSICLENKDFENWHSYFIKENLSAIELIFLKIIFTGDIGGTMGLFLGASFLSVVEIVDFIFTHLTFAKTPKEDQVKKIYLWKWK